MDLWERMGYSLTTDGPEYEQINSMVAFVHERYGEHSAEHMRDGHLCLSDLRCTRKACHPRPVIYPQPREWWELLGQTWAMYFYFELVPRFAHYSPLEYVAVDEFVRLGFAFWSFERLKAYGLAPLSRGSDDNHVHYAWYSHLDRDAMREVEERAKADEESRSRAAIGTA